MSISIRKIEENFDRMLVDGKYYEQEIFTKFEDAFLMETVGSGTASGITLLHGNRSMVRFKTSSMATEKSGELADVRLIMYSPDKRQIRQLLLQFKMYEDVIKIPLKQRELYDEHPDVFPNKKASFSFDPGVLNKTCSSDTMVLHAGTMFATAFHEGGKAKLIMKSGDKRLYVSGKPDWEPKVDSSMEYTSTDGYECSISITSMKEFLEKLKELKIGMPVTYTLVASTARKAKIPPKLMKLGTETFVPDPKDELPVWTLFINVDELED